MPIEQIIDGKPTTDEQYFAVWKEFCLLASSLRSVEEIRAAMLEKLDEQSRKEVLGLL